MNMKCNLDKPRIKGLRVLCAGITAIWLVATIGTYEESKRERYDDRVKPGTVTYGTHSAPTAIPLISVSTRRSAVPMVSGNDVRSSAYYGHSSTPSTASGSRYRLYTTSSVITTAGGNGGGSGIAGGSASSSRGISYGGVSLAVPMQALATPTYTSASLPSMAIASNNLVSNTSNRHIRKAKPTYDGEEDGEEGEDTVDPSVKWYWDEKLEDWVSGIPVGTVKEEDGYYYEWDGSAWVRKGEIADLGTPIGDAPWLWMLLLLAAYALFLGRKVRSERVNE